MTLVIFQAPPSFWSLLSSQSVTLAFFMLRMIVKWKIFPPAKFIAIAPQIHAHVCHWSSGPLVQLHDDKRLKRKSTWMSSFKKFWTFRFFGHWQSCQDLNIRQVRGWNPRKKLYKRSLDCVVMKTGHDCKLVKTAVVLDLDTPTLKCPIKSIPYLYRVKCTNTEHKT